MNLQELSKKIHSCRKCDLFKGATHAVPGEGPSDARVMLVGQNPGKKEDQTGRPFVGRSGTYLDKILDIHEIARDRLFITSVVKHITPDNRKPTQEEIFACLPFLLQQCDLIHPSVIVLMGQVAWQVPHEKEIHYVETYHPAAAMRFPDMGKKFKQDFQRVKQLIDEMK